MVEAEGIAYGHHRIAHLQARRRAQRRRRQVRTVNLDHRDVEAGVGADDLTGEMAPIDQADGDAVGLVDDVRIGQDESAGVVDHAGTEALVGADADDSWADQLGDRCHGA